MGGRMRVADLPKYIQLLPHRIQELSALTRDALAEFFE